MGTRLAFVNVIPLSLRRSQARFVCQNRTIGRRGAVTMSTKTSDADAGGSKLFAVRATDRAGASETREETRGEHLKWAVSDTSPYMEFGGPLRSSHDPTSPVEGSLLIIRGTSMAQVDDALKLDPYVKAGVFDASEVQQWTCGLRSDGDLPSQLYMVWCIDKQDHSALRSDTRPRHLDWWRAAQRKGLIGPFSKDGVSIGTLIVCSGTGLDEVRAWAQTDPYFVVGLFETVHVRAVTKVIEQNALV